MTATPTDHMHRSFKPTLHIAAGLLCVVTYLLIPQPVVQAQGANNDSLSIAQKRLSLAIKERDQARAQLRRQEKMVSETEESIARLQSRVEEEKTKLQQGRRQLAEAQATAEQAQKHHDEASAEIQRFYRERQPEAGPAKP